MLQDALPASRQWYLFFGDFVNKDQIDDLAVQNLSPPPCQNSRSNTITFNICLWHGADTKAAHTNLTMIDQDTFLAHNHAACVLVELQRRYMAPTPLPVLQTGILPEQLFWFWCPRRQSAPSFPHQRSRRINISPTASCRTKPTINSLPTRRKNIYPLQWTTKIGPPLYDASSDTALTSHHPYSHWFYSQYRANTSFKISSRASLLQPLRILSVDDNVALTRGQPGGSLRMKRKINSEFPDVQPSLPLEKRKIALLVSVSIRMQVRNDIVKLLPTDSRNFSFHTRTKVLNGIGRLLPTDRQYFIVRT